jgi:glycosyltransferase involved in cell wall biosynthesis
MKPKLLYIISDDNYFLSHRLGLAKAAQLEGYEVKVLAFNNDKKHSEAIKSHGFEFIQFNQRAHGLGLVNNIKLIWQTRKVINQVSPDLIHTVSMRMVFLTTIAFWISRSKNMVATLTGMGYLETSDRSIIKIIKWTVTKAFKVMLNTKRIQLVVQNSDDYQGVKDKFINQERLHLVRGSGVDVKLFPLLPVPNNKTIQVTFVGRMLKDKGVIELIEAAQIIQQQKIQNIQINLVGLPHEANPFSLTENQLKRWQKQSFIKWHGFRDDIKKVWSESHIAILPSYREGLPKSLLEAASCGRPIITTNVPGCKEMVNGKNGIIVEEKSAQALAQAIIKLSKNKELFTIMGQESREMVINFFSDEVVNRQMLSIYRKLINT